MQFYLLNPYKTVLAGTEGETIVQKDFEQEEKIAALFGDLQQFDYYQPLKDALLAQEEKLNARCDQIIDHQTLLSGKYSKIFITAAFKVKMEMWQRCFLICRRSAEPERKELAKTYKNRITENLSTLFAMEREACELAASFTETEKQYLKFPYNLSSELGEFLIPCFPLKDRVTAAQMSVPDVLASASLTCNSRQNLVDIRKIFHELWQLQALQPTLTLAAYASQGYFCNCKGEVEIKDRSEGLRIIFSDREINGRFGENVVYGLRTEKMVFISLGEVNGDGRNVALSKLAVRGIVSHELHHFAEGIIHQNSSLPYLKNEENLQLTKRLDAMVKEAQGVTKQHSYVAIEEQESSTPKQQPFQTFFDLARYQQNKKHTEIVVRVPQALASMVGAQMSDGRICDETIALKIMQECRLEECVKFFGEEREKFALAVQRLREIARVEFVEYDCADLTQPHPLTRYLSTSLHDAVRSESTKILVDAIEANTNLLETDSLNQNALELAIEMNKPELVFAFCDSEKVLTTLATTELRTLNKTMRYLTELTIAHTETELGSQAARAIAQIEQITMDQGLIKQLAAMTNEQILTGIRSEELQLKTDHFLNPPKHYLLRAGKKDLSDAVERDFYPSFSTGCLVEKTPLHKAANKNDPEEFLSAIKAAEVIPASLDMFRQNNAPLKFVVSRMARDFQDGRIDQAQKWIAPAKALIARGCDPFEIPTTDARSFAKLAADEMPNLFAKMINEIFLEDQKEEARKILAESLEAKKGAAPNVSSAAVALLAAGVQLAAGAGHQI